MHGIYIMGIVTTVFALLLIGGILLYRTSRKEWWFLFLVFAMVLPMQPLVYYLIRIPLDRWLHSLLGLNTVYKVITTFYAPLTEEPAKLWILLLPWIASRIDEKNYIRIAIAIGLGFGIGEMWFVAYEVSKIPEYTGMPWYYFLGYLNERTMVCFFHGAFTMVALKFLKKRFILGFLGAVGLHYLANLPIFLARVDPLGWGEYTWGIILSVWIPVYLIAMGLMVTYLGTGGFNLGRGIYGTDICPDCGKEYNKPLFLAVNLLNKRYERCPHCKKWHMMPSFPRKKNHKKGGE
jgi:hypothetical protein